MFCDTQKQEVNQGSLYFWVYVFFLSKFYEWLDTVLMVLKKVNTSYILLFLTQSHQEQIGFFACVPSLGYYAVGVALS